MDSFAPPGDRRDIAGNRPDGLTGIPHAYTLLASTPEQGSETDRIMIDHFLTTLAEIAMAIASRRLQGEEKGGE